MEGILLVAAGGLSREALAVQRALTRFRTIRLVDDNATLWGSELDDAPVVGGLAEVMRYDSSAIVVCAGHGAARRRIVERLADLGVTSDRFTRVVHPSVDLPDGCTVGDGSILLAQVVLTAHVMVGRTASSQTWMGSRSRPPRRATRTCGTSMWYASTTAIKSPNGSARQVWA